jgi:IclR family KDG regulon transcriptional repressor
METSQTIEKTMLLLQTLAENERSTAAEVTRALEVHRSTTYRMLKSLVQLGFVDHQEESGFYSLSSKMGDLLHPKSSYTWLSEIVSPYMEEFHSKVNETLHLAVLKYNELCYLNKWESSRSLRVVIQSKAGGFAPLHCTGLGKMLLSGLDSQELKEILPRLTLIRFTKNTISELDTFRHELLTIQKRGTSYDNEEHEEGVCCISVPLVDKEGKTVAAISITVPGVRFTQKRKAELLDEITSIGHKISKDICNLEKN